MIDAGCLALLWRLTRREGIRLFDLVGLERKRLGRDALLALLLIPPSLLFILGGVYAAGWLLYGTLVPFAAFATLVYLRLRRLIPLALSHALMDGTAASIGVLLPLLRG